MSLIISQIYSGTRSSACILVAVTLSGVALEAFTFHADQKTELDRVR